MIWKLLTVISVVVLGVWSADPEIGSSCDPAARRLIKEFDCSTYFSCEQNSNTGNYEWMLNQCIPRMRFDENTQKCVLATEDCQGILDIPKAPLEPRAIAAGCEENFDCPNNLQFFIYPDWKDCTAFYICQMGQITRARCQAMVPVNSVLYYDAREFACKPPTVNSNTVCLVSGLLRPS